MSRKAILLYPANPQLWNRLEAQARSKYPPRNPSSGRLSFPAAKWLRDQYTQDGGQFVDSKRDVDPRFRDRADELAKKKKEKQRELEKRRKRGEAI